MRKDVTSTTRQQQKSIFKSIPSVNSDGTENSGWSSMRLFSTQQLVQEDITTISSSGKKLWNRPGSTANNDFAKSKKAQEAERSSIVNRHPQVSLLKI